MKIYFVLALLALFTPSCQRRQVLNMDQKTEVGPSNFPLDQEKLEQALNISRGSSNFTIVVEVEKTEVGGGGKNCANRIRRIGRCSDYISYIKKIVTQFGTPWI